jgi:hypothetical protein
VKSYGASHQSGGLPKKSTALNDHSQLAQSSRFGDFHTTASISRYYAELSSKLCRRECQANPLRIF